MLFAPSIHKIVVVDSKIIYPVTITCTTHQLQHTKVTKFGHFLINLENK